MKRLILYSRLYLFQLILGYNNKQLIAEDLSCYVFAWTQFYLTCKTWRLRKHEAGSSLCVLILLDSVRCATCSTQGSFISEMERAPLSVYFGMLMTQLFLCDTDLVTKVCWIMTMTTNAENFRQYKSRFSLIAEQILAFPSSTYLVRNVTSLPPNFKRIA